MKESKNVVRKIGKGLAGALMAGALTSCNPLNLLDPHARNFSTYDLSDATFETYSLKHGVTIKDFDHDGIVDLIIPTVENKVLSNPSERESIVSAYSGMYQHYLDSSLELDSLAIEKVNVLMNAQREALLEVNRILFEDYQKDHPMGAKRKAKRMLGRRK
jgi:hypothetical protein